MKNVLVRLLGTLLALCLWCSLAAANDTPSEASVRQVWQLLDYVGVDYGGAVADGKVLSEAEYAEMREFAANALRQAQALPPNTARERLVAAVAAVQQAVEQRVHSTEVAALARQAGDQLLAAYPVPVAPKALPDLQRGAALYQAQCASCHGAGGHGDGPLAARLDPKPVAFTERERARSRSVLALYQIVTQGVGGTSMPGFASLPESDRWALAFFAGGLSYDAAMRERGQALWKNSSAARTQFGDLAAVTTTTEGAAATALGADEARDVVAYLRSQPQAVAQGKPTGVALARAQLQRSVAAARAGNFPEATRLGLSAYLDGFEPLEPTLSARNKDLTAQVEARMLSYRGALASGRAEEAAAMAQQLDGVFAQVESELGKGAADPVTTFLGALTILLREGVEALLIIVGMLAFLRKAQRHDVVRHVHAGWMSALAAGGATWGVATYVVGISGASREVTEGVSSLFAALVLLAVGLWMHQKSSAGRWQAYLKDKLSSAMSRRSAWALFALAFIAVYREVFETVLFYSALAVEGNGAALLGGLAAGVAILAVIAWALMRTSARMPIGKFFSISSVLVALLAVVLCGKGVAALQEAGWLSASPIPSPRIELLGLFPSLETVTAQLVVLAIALVGFRLNALSGRRAQPPRAA
ncbi:MULTISPECIES: FTR1 family protein [Azohydromonas]|jgi:high-affinity iron transporter|uniref:FTR1 family protein n=1 Tax=Azohydromonas lata TaxID=45677 RepID=A0ABU5IAS1_9BURK|nr:MULTISPECIES: FTR1 family protein [Azohydromonas]MDZ5455706.1 FTR1 family protein [Azohydromonas lata]